jgi:hypothetical protein
VTRLTPEREAEIRAISDFTRVPWIGPELLDEIDALRAELDIERTAHAKTQEELVTLRTMILGAIEAEAEQFRTRSNQ